MSSGISVDLCFCVHVYLSVYIFMCLMSASLSVYICLSVCMYICQSVYMSVCLLYKSSLALSESHIADCLSISSSARADLFTPINIFICFNVPDSWINDY